MLPESGSVLGIDVGWSLKARSSAVCRLDWNGGAVSWIIRRFTAAPNDRRDAILATAGTHDLLAAAFDGPLRGDLAPIEVYRTAERMLSERAIRESIGKLAQSNSGNGRLLNAATHACAAIVLESATLAEAKHAHPIHRLAIAEAFPNSFLGLMLAEPSSHKGGRGQRSDRYYQALVADGTLERLLGHHLPGRLLEKGLVSVTNHDDRAALVCAITALGVAGNDYTAVGEHDGWIIMPPPALVADWARPIVAGWNQAPSSGLSR